MSRYTAQALAFFKARAIDPAVAADLGVVQDGDSLIFPPVGRRRDLNGGGPAKVRQPAGKKLELWCLSPPGPAVLLAEGETDALAAYTALTLAPADAAPITSGLGVAAVPGTGTPADRVVDGVQGAEIAYVAMDADDAGRRASRKYVTALAAAGIRAVTVELPDGSDLADYVAAQGDPGRALPNLLADAAAAEPVGPIRHDTTDLTVEAILEAAGVDLPEDADDLDAKGLLALLKGGKVADRVVELVEDAGVQLFHDENRVAFAVVPVDDHLETHRVRSKEFELYVPSLYHRQEETVLASHARRDAEGLLEARAVFDSPMIPVHLRVSGDSGAVYIDLGDDEWRAIRITAEGWEVLAQHPVRFRRTAGMAALPVPEPGGSLDELLDLLNLEAESDRRLTIGWLLDAARPGTPFAVLELTGEEGTTKSTAARALRAMIDPSTTPLRRCPTKSDDLFVAANASWITAFDNVSGVQQWLSDDLCRLATGGGQSKRELYTDEGEHLIDVRRPVIVNGIEEVAVKGDLLRRTLRVELPLLDDADRLTESEFWSRFDAVHPRLLGALCDALSCSLRRVGEIEIERKPSMADLAEWVTAAEPALGWPDGAFMEAYEVRRNEAHEVVVESELAGPYIRQMCEEEFEGTATELLGALDELVDGSTRQRTEWPKSPRRLSGIMKRIAPALRKLGYAVDRGDWTRRGTPWLLGRRSRG